MLEIKDICFSYPALGNPVLYDLGFKMSRGRILGILGENGSGKTTLLRIVSGILTPDSGNVYWNGEPVFTKTEKLIPGHEKIKLIFQDFRLYEKYTVEENLSMILPPYYKDSEKEKRITNILNQFKLTGFRRRKAATLSGGEKQKVAIARSLITGPEVVLMDEPFSSLDPFMQDEIKDSLFNVLSYQNITTIFVTHNSEDALKYSDRLLVMRHGKIVRSGKPETLYRHPASSYVAKLTGPVNIITPRYYFPELNNRTKNVFIRPSEILLTNQKESISSAKILSVRFFGTFYEVQLHCSNGCILKVHASEKPESNTFTGLIFNKL